MCPESKIHNLKVRAAKLAQVRDFFTQRGVMEVDCLALHSYPTIDAYIDPVELYPCGPQRRFLHTSPEYKMKRLLCFGIGDIYQVSHVFRKGEESNRHSPEFTMIEWYRVHMNLETLITETIELIELFTDKRPSTYYTYYEALFEFGSIQDLSKESLIHCLERHHITHDPEWTLQQLLHLTWSEVIEQKFVKNHFTVVTNFPAFEAALAKVDHQTTPPTARRFEIYFEGYELANGYDELQDVEEHIRRFTKYNAMRAHEGKETYEMDIDLLRALEKGLPASSGVAVGFDRLLMLHLRTNNIHDVIF